MGVSGESLISILSHAPNSELDQALAWIPSLLLPWKKPTKGWAEERNQNQTGKEEEEALTTFQSPISLRELFINDEEQGVVAQLQAMGKWKERGSDEVLQLPQAPPP